MRLVPVDGKYTLGYIFGVPTFYSKFHLGIDYVTPKGRPVIASESGEVVYVGVGQQGGRTIHLRGISGALMRYLHLDTWWVKKGDRVVLGQQLGTVGNTGILLPNGKPTVPHLHFDVWTTGKIDLKGRKGLVDPAIWLKEGGPMVSEGNANGILYAITKKEINPESKALADALNSGNQKAVTEIIETAIFNKIKQ